MDEGKVDGGIVGEWIVDGRIVNAGIVYGGLHN